VDISCCSRTFAVRGYGKAFQDANIKDLGGGDLDDVVAGTKFLAATGYVNSKKIGITGGSYGGFMTLMALGKGPDVFAAGVNQFGIINWFSMWENGVGGLREYKRALVGDPVADKAAYERKSPDDLRQGHPCAAPQSIGAKMTCGCPRARPMRLYS